MTAIPIPLHGRWAWDLRGEGRAVRVSTHAEAGLLNLSIWRGDVCVGTVRLLPEDAARVVTGLSDGLAELASAEVAAGSARDRRMHELELRVAQVEAKVRPPGWQRAPRALAEWAARTGWERRR